MTGTENERYSRQYAQYIAKEVTKEAAASIFGTLRAALKEHASAPQNRISPEASARILEVLSDVECRYYNEFKPNEVFEEVVSR